MGVGWESTPVFPAAFALQLVALEKAMKATTGRNKGPDRRKDWGRVLNKNSLSK